VAAVLVPDREPVQFDAVHFFGNALSKLRTK